MLLNYFRTLQQLNRNVLLYLAATAMIGLAFDGGVFSVLFNLYLLRLGFGPEFIGQVAAAGLLSFSLASLPAGSMGERWGYRAVMINGLILIVGGGVLLPLAEGLPSTWLAPSILTIYTIMFAGLGLYFVNAVPYVMHISTANEHHRAFSMQTALLAFAAFAGSLGGGYLPRFFSTWLDIDQHHAAAYRYPLLLATILLIPSIWILSRIRAPHQAHEANTATDTEIATASTEAETIGESSTTPLTTIPATPSQSIPKVAPWLVYSPILITILLLSVVRFFQVSGVATVYTFFNVYMDTELAVPTSSIGLIAAVARLIGVFAALITPVLITRWGTAPTVLFASIVSTISTLPLAFVPTWYAAGLGFIGVTAISSMRYPAFMIYATGLVPANWRGTLAGIGEFAGGMSFAGLAFIGGSMAENQGFSTLFMLGGLLTLAGTILFYFWFMLPNKKSLPIAEAAIDH